MDFEKRSKGAQPGSPRTFNKVNSLKTKHQNTENVVSFRQVLGFIFMGVTFNGIT